jgi:hypothetical protein
MTSYDMSLHAILRDFRVGVKEKMCFVGVERAQCCGGEGWFEELPGAAGAGGVAIGPGASSRSFAAGNSDGIANRGSCNESGAAACDGLIPFASTIDHRQSSSGPGVIPIFS